MVDKANVLETFWRRVVKTVSESYPDVALEFLFVDNAAINHPESRQFDVVLTRTCLVIFYLTKQV
jgi:3-isopropylmalate dehydrogenase